MGQMLTQVKAQDLHPDFGFLFLLFQFFDTLPYNFERKEDEEINTISLRLVMNALIFEFFRNY